MSDGEDYSDSLNLPRTDFPMRGGLPQREPEWLKFWTEIDLWGELRRQSLASGRTKYILHDGPPYANGHLHIGHALNKILKDIICRSRQMLGYDSHYVPGWDCHGLPIEWKIEEKYRSVGKDKDSVDVVEFRRECRDFAEHWLCIQRDEFKRLGVMGDWDEPYQTMDYGSESIIAGEFCKFLMSGSLYRGEKPVLWSIVEKTALAEAEVEYKEHKSISLYVRFPIVESASSAYVGASIVIWTTTAWTVPCNRAIAFHEGLEYGLYEVTDSGEHKCFANGEKFLCAVLLLDSFIELAGIVVRKVSGVDSKDLEGMVAHHPLRGLGYEHDVPLHHADFVDDSQGTGFVHVSPSHGTDDYYFGLRHGLSLPPTVSEDGHYTEHMPYFAGETIYESDGSEGTANVAVIRALAEAKALLGKRKLAHSYPHSWRSKAPLIYRNTRQWFIGMEENDLRKKSLQAIEKTLFYPQQGKARLYDMIENRPDWCISRQRAWGVPLTIFIHKESDEPLRDVKVNERICKIFAEEGADAWFVRPNSDFLGADYDGDDYEKVCDVLDVWFDSGSTHSFVLEQMDDWPADLYLEGTDQHRGWFHSSLLESCGTRGRAPYKAVMTHGFVLAEDGQKMSKSLGNITTPQEVYDEHGADILRLWVVASNYYEELSIGPKTLKQHSDSYRRFRNTWRFLLGNLSDFNPKKDACAYGDLEDLDKWALHRLSMLDKNVRKYCDEYDFHKMFRDLHNFCTFDLSAIYFDIRKDTLYCEYSDVLKKQSTQTVLHELFNCLTIWLAPILCFTAEEAWQSRREALGSPKTMERSVHLCEFPEIPKAWHNKEIAYKITELVNFRQFMMGDIELERVAGNIKSSLEALPIVAVSSSFHKQLLDFGFSDSDLADKLAEFCIVSNFILQKDKNTTHDITIIKICRADSEIDKAVLEALPIISESGSLRNMTIEQIALAKGAKCRRCWKILPEVAESSGSICTRCCRVIRISNLMVMVLKFMKLRFVRLMVRNAKAVIKYCQRLLRV